MIIGGRVGSADAPTQPSLNVVRCEPLVTLLSPRVGIGSLGNQAPRQKVLVLDHDNIFSDTYSNKIQHSFFIGALCSACDEGPGVCSRLLTVFSLFLIIVSLPLSLFVVVKVVQVIVIQLWILILIIIVFVIGIFPALVF